MKVSSTKAESKSKGYRSAKKSTEKPESKASLKRRLLSFKDSNFENRKRDHVRLAMLPEFQTQHLSALDRVTLTHEALPDLNFDEIEIKTSFLGIELGAPLFVSSMTAGHKDGVRLNRILAQGCSEKNWLMGVGSQRRELFEKSASKEWLELRRAIPKAKLMGNLGLAQIIATPISEIERLVEALEPVAMIVHLNPLQECLQPEGTPNFKGGIRAIENLCKSLSVPLIVKETGCGMSLSTLKKLSKMNLCAIDVSGLGGTHWGRIEGGRSPRNSTFSRGAQVFKDWGISTVESLVGAVSLRDSGSLKSSLWASGGVRTGLDAAKLLSLGADMVGFAQPALGSALEGRLIAWMSQIEFELKVAMFCTGSQSVEALREKGQWKRQ